MKIYQWRSLLIESELTPNAKLIGIVISEFHRDGKDCYPSLSTILHLSSFGSINTVQKSIKELKESGLLRVESKKRNHVGGKPCNMYIFSGVTEQISRDDSSYDSSHDISHDISRGDKETTESNNLKKKENKKEKNETSSSPPSAVLPNPKNLTKTGLKYNYPMDYIEFSNAYPHHGLSYQGYAAYYKVITKDRIPKDSLLSAVKMYASKIKRTNTKKQHTKHQSSWLNQKCWTEEDIEQKRNHVVVMQDREPDWEDLAKTGGYYVG